MKLQTSVFILFWDLTLSMMELPKFHQLTTLYPGYYQYDGRYKDHEIRQLVGVMTERDYNKHGKHVTFHTHDTASIRISWMLNRFGGRHAIGKQPIFLSKRGRDSITGEDGQEYIFRNTAFGPYLAAKYGNPLIIRPASIEQIMGKQGIVRLVSYKVAKKHHPSGHVALWDCDHFYQSKDWMNRTQDLISIELWQTPDSYCPPSQSTATPQRVIIDKETALHLVQQLSFEKVSRHHYNHRKHNIEHNKNRRT